LFRMQKRSASHPPRSAELEARATARSE